MPKIDIDTNIDTDNKINDIKNLIDRSNQIVLDKNIDHCVILLGKTGVGKSTIAEFVSNFDALVTTENETGDNIITNILDNNIIQNDKSSGTTIPNIRIISDTAIIDCPGFFDTNGPEQEIPNSFYIKKIFKLATHYKLFILISSEEFFGPRFDASMFKPFAELFGDNLNKVLQSTYYILMKNKRKSNHIVANVKKCHNATNDCNIKMILDNMLDSNKIILFPKAKKNIRFAECSDMIDKKNEITRIMMCRDGFTKVDANAINIYLSPDCMVYGNKIAQYLFDDLMKYFSRVIQIIDNNIGTLDITGALNNYSEIIGALSCADTDLNQILLFTKKILPYDNIDNIIIAVNIFPSYDYRQNVNEHFLDKLSNSLNLCKNKIIVLEELIFVGITKKVIAIVNNIKNQRIRKNLVILKSDVAFITDCQASTINIDTLELIVKHFSIKNMSHLKNDIAKITMNADIINDKLTEKIINALSKLKNIYSARIKIMKQNIKNYLNISVNTLICEIETQSLNLNSPQQIKNQITQLQKYVNIFNDPDTDFCSEIKNQVTTKKSVLQIVSTTKLEETLVLNFTHALPYINSSHISSNFISMTRQVFLLKLDNVVTMLKNNLSYHIMLTTTETNDLIEKYIKIIETIGNDVTNNIFDSNHTFGKLSVDDKITILNFIVSHDSGILDTNITCDKYIYKADEICIRKKIFSNIVIIGANIYKISISNIDYFARVKKKFIKNIETSCKEYCYHFGNH
jgi:hypothetical protein